MGREDRVDPETGPGVGASRSSGGGRKVILALGAACIFLCLRMSAQMVSMGSGKILELRDAGMPGQAERMSLQRASDFDSLMSVDLARPGWVGGLGDGFHGYVEAFDKQKWFGEDVAKVSLQDLLAAGVHEHHAADILLFIRMASHCKCKQGQSSAPALQAQPQGAAAPAASGTGAGVGSAAVDQNSPTQSLQVQQGAATPDPAASGSGAVVSSAAGDGFKTRLESWVQQGSEAVIKIPEGVHEGACIRTALVFKGGGHFTVELRGNQDPTQTECRMDATDTVHLHLRLGNNPFEDGSIFAVAGAAFGTGKEHLWLAEQHFEDTFAGRPDVRQELQICNSNMRLVVSVDGKEVTAYEPQWDASSVACMSIKDTVKVAAEQVSLSLPINTKALPCRPAYQRCEPKRTHAFPYPSPGILQAYYINLAKRTDRRSRIEAELSAALLPFDRMDAFNAMEENQKDPSIMADCWDGPPNRVKVCAGQIGCQRSHLKVIELAMEKKLPYVAVFEDDFIWQPWLNKTNVQTIIAATMTAFPDWDVIALSLNIEAESVVGKLDVPCMDGAPCVITKIHSAQTTGGYIMRDTIYEAIHYRFSNEFCKVRQVHGTAIDQCWKALQIIYNFYAFEPQLGTQAKGFSDIENGQVDYRLARRR